MANQKDIEAHYDTIGVLHALRMHKVHKGFPDYTCAFFNGDFSKSIKQAQEDKHAWIFKNLGLGIGLTGKKILDIGCGWGPLLHAIQTRGGMGIGLTLSSHQTDYCVKHGLDVQLKDYKDLKQNELTNFDGVASVGSMEAYCSIEEYQAGRQMEIYRNFFKICAERLPQRGRLFVQTMIWGKKVPDLKSVSLEAPPHSEEAILARIAIFYPGSWLPSNREQIIEAAKPYFTYVMSNNGRLDYLETLKRWGQNTKYLFTPSILPKSLKAMLRIVGRAMIDKDTRIQLASLYYRDQEECFMREIMSHERMFFERK